MIIIVQVAMMVFICFKICVSVISLFVKLMDIMELEDCAHYVNNLVKHVLNRLLIVRPVWMDIHFSSLQTNA